MQGLFQVFSDAHPQPDPVGPVYRWHRSPVPGAGVAGGLGGDAVVADSIPRRGIESVKSVFGQHFLQCRSI